ncbi:MAG: formate--tetrahydrofolate ligase [Clostridia bacterium]|nr:formate--tetrahydrofolate ligase [Clostridia bacterium]
MTDIEIANSVTPTRIVEVAKKIGLNEDDLILYGKYKAKIDKKLDGKKAGKLVLVTAISPTKAGNGKTTVSIGLADGLAQLGERVCLALREPSLGPVFGIKGGATGGGYSQIVPMEDINLHFNGDFHAITSANNLLSSLIDNHVFQGNELQIDCNNIFFKRCLDLNDRALRECTVNETKNCTPRKEHFTITAASEIMAIMCLAKDLTDLKARLGNIMVALNTDGKPVYARDLHAQDAMAILLKDALKPNLVQTLAGTPAIVHCGPFANIAHGCNSVIATRTALSLADYCVTEAGFGADLGAEKFIDLKCRLNGFKPNCVVLVATIRALKLNGGADDCDLATENLNALKNGLPNLMRHLNAITDVYKLPCVVTINRFITDTDAEIELVRTAVGEKNVACVINEVWAKGGTGALNLARAVIDNCNKPNDSFSFAYDLDESVKDKIFDVAHKIYGAKSVVYTEQAEKSLKNIHKLGLDGLPVIMAKTQFSFTDDAKRLGAPTDFELTVRDVEIRSGAGFLVVLLGNMMLMPALSASPAAIKMTIDENEHITGLF